MHTNLSHEQIAANQNELDGIIKSLDRGASDASTSLLEHLKCAKVYLLGSMPEEYAIELDMAAESAAGLPDKDLRRSTTKTIDHLKSELAGSDETRRSEMNSDVPIRHRPPHESTADAHGRLWDFFGPAPVKMGSFYPTGFVAAVVPSYDAAENALQALRTVGFEEDDVIAVRGEEMSAFLEELRMRTGVWGQLMGALSRTIGTERLFSDQDLDLARSGSGFLLVYCPDEDEAKLIRETVRPFGSTFMQRYLAGAVDGLIKPASPTLGPEL